MKNYFDQSLKLPKMQFDGKKVGFIWFHEFKNTIISNIWKNRSCCHGISDPFPSINISKHQNLPNGANEEQGS